MIYILLFLLCINPILSSSEQVLELETIIDTAENDFIDLDRKTKNPVYSRKKVSRPYKNPTPRLKTTHLFLEGEYLYWKPYAFIPYAVKNTLVGNNLGTNYENPQLNLKAHFGFRGTLGIYLPEPTWYLTGIYTQFSAKGSDFISTEGRSRRNEIKLSYIWAAVSPVSEANTGPGDASATEKVSYRNIDTSLNKTFNCSSCFNLDTFFGVRYSKIAVKMDILYTEQDATSGQFGKVQVKLDNNFNALGIRAGFKTNWRLGKGVEIFGTSSLSSLTGKFLLRDHQYIFRPSDGDLSPVIDSSGKFSDIYTSAELALGLIWGSFIKKDVYIGFKAGYELNVWPSFIRIKKIPNRPTILTRTLPFKNFLAMQGLSASIKFDF